ncbi:hypothetical protein EJB05_14012, partial [Eragrostis curvula]
MTNIESSFKLLTEFRYGNGQWTENNRQTYNLVHAQARHTVQKLCIRKSMNSSESALNTEKCMNFTEQTLVYPNGWSAILVSLDKLSFSNEYSIPTNAILWQSHWSATLTKKIQHTAD